MSRGQIIIRVAQGIFVAVVITFLIRHYAEKSPETFVQVQDCMRTSPINTRCVTYMARVDSTGRIMRKGE